MKRLSGVSGFLLIILAIWLMADPFGEWMAGLSDSTWWAVLPWVLLVVFWVVMIRQLLKRRQQSE